MSKIRQRLEARQPLWVNWYVDEYIGGGATSEVYKLSERRFNQVSAVKVISWNSKNMPAFSTSSTYNTLKEYRSRAESEIRAMYELQNCPYIVHCKNHDFWDYYDEDMNLIGFDVLIQMDFWDCFQEKLLENDFNTEENDILKFAKNITSALVAAHAKGIIHRDIKPENIFIDNSGNYLLGDFGVSKQAENNLLSTTTGTKPFMAPEIFNRKKYDKTVDIYSLGIVLYMLLNNNRLPFVTEEMSFNEVQDAVYDRMNGKPLDPPVNGSSELKRIVLKCCEFKAEDRYASATELFDDLNKLDMMRSGYGAQFISKPEAPAAVQPTVTETPAPEQVIEAEDKANTASENTVPDAPASDNAENNSDNSDNSDDTENDFETFYAAESHNETELPHSEPAAQTSEPQIEKADTADSQPSEAESDISHDDEHNEDDEDDEADFETFYAPSSKELEKKSSPAANKTELPTAPIKEDGVKSAKKEKAVTEQPVDETSDKAQAVEDTVSSADDSDEETFETVYASSKTDVSAVKSKPASAPAADSPKAKKAEKKKAPAEKKEKPVKAKADKKAEKASKAPEAGEPKKKPNAKKAAVLSAAALVVAGGITGAVLYANRDAEIVMNFEEEEGKIVNIYAWNGEFKTYFERYFTGQIPINGKGEFFENAPGKKYIDQGIKFNWITYSDEDGYYDRKLSEALERQEKVSNDQKIDLFLVEADYITKYVESDYTMDVSKLGIKQLSTEYEYTVKAARSSKGVLKGVSYQCCPSALIYRRSIAKEVLGTDDPKEVQSRLNWWYKFDDVAETAKQKGYYMTASYAETFRAFSSNTTQPWVDSKLNLNIPASIDHWIDQAKLYTEKGYTLNNEVWSDEKNEQMYKNGKTMCFFGPSWYINTCMDNAQNSSRGCYGDWAICPGPQVHFWGGTWLLAAEGTDNPRVVSDIMKAFTSNDEVCSALIANENQFTNNKRVNKKFASDLNYGNAFLGGQNDIAVYMEIADKIIMQNQTSYDAQLNNLIQEGTGEYCAGHLSKQETIEWFRNSAKECYPQLK